MKKISLFFTIVFCLSCLSGMLTEASSGEKPLDNWATRMDVIRFITGQNPDALEAADPKILDGYIGMDVYDEKDRLHIACALEIGVLRGYGDNDLRLNQPITRAEFAAAIWRAAKYILRAEPLMESTPTYHDIPDWAYDGAKLCMDYGLMMGYGEQFGSGDFLTMGQLSIVKYRLSGSYKYTTYERYALCSAGGVGPLKMDKVLESARADRFIVTKQDDPYDGKASTSVFGNPWKWFNQYNDVVRSLNYKDLDTPEKREEMALEEVGLRGYPADSPQGPKPSQEQLKFYEDCYNQRLHIESFIASDDRNCGGFSPAPSIGSTICKGYEYYCYVSGLPEALPEGTELGKWYRREVKLIFERSRTRYYQRTYYLSEPELVPADFFF